MTNPRLTPTQVASLLLDTEPYLSCQECFDLMDAYVDAVALGHPVAAPDGLLHHLAGCPACAEETESLLALVTHDHSPQQPTE